MSIYYVYATTTNVYVFDDSFSIVDSKPLTTKDAVDIARNTLSDAEQELVQAYTGHTLYFCNYKEGSFSNVTDLEVVRTILSRVEHPPVNQTKTVSQTYFSQKLTEYVTWDLQVCQAVKTIEELTKTINLLAKRLREWFEWQLPEFSKKIDSHEYFIQQVATHSYDELFEKVQFREDAPLGGKFEAEDSQQIQSLANTISELIHQQNTLKLFVENKITKHAPSFTALAGSQIGGKLLMTAGSFERLMKMTASTIQVLGAEKALFRHLKTGAKPPKYGMLFQHPLVAKAKSKQRGQVARMLANALSLAVKADYFHSTSFNAQQYIEKIEGISR